MSKHNEKQESKLVEYKLSNDNELRTDYFSIGQFGFLRTREIDGVERNMFDTFEDIATLVVISSFNVQDMNSEFLHTHQLTPFMIASRFGFKNQSRNFKRVLQSINNLRKNGVIRLIDCETGKKMDDDKVLEKHTLFKAYQDKSRNRIIKNTDEQDVKIYNSMLHKYFSKIVDGHTLQDNDKFYLLAAYATVTTKMNAWKKGYEEYDIVTNNFAHSMVRLQVINFQTHSNLAEASHMSRNTFSKYVGILVDMNILARVAVRRRCAPHKVSYYYSKGYQGRILAELICGLIYGYLPQQYDHLNINEVVSVSELKNLNFREFDDDYIADKIEGTIEEEAIEVEIAKNVVEETVDEEVEEVEEVEETVEEEVENVGVDEIEETVVAETLNEKANDFKDDVEKEGSENSENNKQKTLQEIGNEMKKQMNQTFIVYTKQGKKEVELMSEAHKEALESQNRIFLDLYGNVDEFEYELDDEESLFAY